MTDWLLDTVRDLWVGFLGLVLFAVGLTALGLVACLPVYAYQGVRWLLKRGGGE